MHIDLMGIIWYNTLQIYFVSLLSKLYYKCAGSLWTVFGTSKYCLHKKSNKWAWMLIWETTSQIKHAAVQMMEMPGGANVIRTQAIRLLGHMNILSDRWSCSEPDLSPHNPKSFPFPTMKFVWEKKMLWWMISYFWNPF